MDKTRNKIFVGCLALLLVMVVGYALFSQSLNITGTAKAQGDFNIEIVRAEITSEKGSAGATATISNDGRALTITIPKLEYPGAYVDVSYTVKNTGTIDAIFNTHKITGTTNKIKAEYYDVSDMLYLASNTEAEGSITIKWDDSVNLSSEESATIKYEINYNQINDKDAACTALKEKAKIIEECDGWIRDPESDKECQDLSKNDVNGDGAINISDSSGIEAFTILKLNCPKN